MEWTAVLETPVGVFRVSDGEKTIPFEIRKNRYLDRPRKVRDDTGLVVGSIDTDAKYSIYVPLSDLEPERDYTISFSAGNWKPLGAMGSGHCYDTVIEDWVVGIGGEDPDESRTIFYAVYPLEENNGYRFRLFDKVRAHAHFDVAWVQMQADRYRLGDYEDAVYSWLNPHVRLADMQKCEEPFRALEEELWKAAQSRDAKAFLELVNEDAVMVCGGSRLSGAEYAEIIRDFDCRSYAIERFEIVCETAESVQVHYVIILETENEQNKDLAGTFHVTTTWRRSNGRWKVVFHMDRNG